MAPEAAGLPIATPSATMDQVGRIQVVVTSADGHLWRLGRNLSYVWNWHDEGTEGGGFAGSSPDIVIDDSNRYLIFVVSADGHLWRRNRNVSNNWTWWDMGTRGGGFGVDGDLSMPFVDVSPPRSPTTTY